MGRIGIEELIVVLVVVLFLFGGQKIPELMRGLGRGTAEFKRGLREGKAGETGEVGE